MNSSEFRERGKEMVDYVCDYLDTVASRRVTSTAEPGYLKKLLPSEAPQKPENWEDIMRDVEDKIMPGITHWQHPRFHAYFPSGNSFPSILGDLLSDAIGCIGFSWAASPACSELETIVLDWFGKAIGLPADFLAFTEGSKGGGVIQTSASECILVAMLAARAEAIRKLKEIYPDEEDGALLAKLVAYCSKESHSCVEKGAMITFVKLHVLETDENNSLRGDTVREAMEEDRAEGRVPFFISTTLGTTSCCSFDNIAEIGPVCEDFDVWLQVDGAYAGNAFICPEFRPLMNGIEHAMSFNTNTNKWLLVNFDCSTMWTRDRFKLTQGLVVDPLYLQHSHQDMSIDFRHWGIPLSRRFRALKLWFVLRCYGIEGLQNYIREHCRLAKYFESFVRKDDRFQVVNEVKMGLVCFRLKKPDKINQELLASINASGKLHMIPSRLKDKYIIRFCVCAENATDSDIEYAWNAISETAADLLEAYKTPATPKEMLSPDLIQAGKDWAARRRRLVKRFSFTRSVSKDVFRMSRTNSLYDGVSPIIVLDDDQEDVFFGNGFIKEDVSNGCIKEEESVNGDEQTVNGIQKKNNGEQGQVNGTQQPLNGE